MKKTELKNEIAVLKQRNRTQCESIRHLISDLQAATAEVSLLKLQIKKLESKEYSQGKEWNPEKTIFRQDDEGDVSKVSYEELAAENEKMKNTIELMAKVNEELTKSRNGLKNKLDEIRRLI